MTGRRAVFGLCMLCALAFGIVAAQSASAAIPATTAFTCKKTGPGGTFKKAHCKAEDAGAGEFSHVKIAAGTVTEVTATNEGSGPETKTTVSSVLTGKLGGVAITITCTGVHATGTQENTGGTIEGETTEILYTGCTMKPATCTVKKNKIEGEAFSVSVHKGEGALEKGLLFTGKEAGGSFASITVEGASCPLGNPKTFSVRGKAVGRLDGATITFNAGEDELELAETGEKTADLTGTVTVLGKAKADPGFTPLSVTTLKTEE